MTDDYPSISDEINHAIEYLKENNLLGVVLKTIPGILSSYYIREQAHPYIVVARRRGYAITLVCQADNQEDTEPCIYLILARWRLDPTTAARVIGWPQARLSLSGTG